MYFLGLNAEARFRGSSVLIGFSRFYCGGNSAAKAKMSSETRRRTDENGGDSAPTAHKIHVGLPNAGAEGKLSGISLPADHQGEQGQNRLLCRKFPNSPRFLAKPYGF